MAHRCTTTAYTYYHILKTTFVCLCICWVFCFPLPYISKVLYMSSDEFLLAIESRDLENYKSVFFLKTEARTFCKRMFSILSYLPLTRKTENKVSKCQMHSVRKLHRENPVFITGNGFAVHQNSQKSQDHLVL